MHRTSLLIRMGLLTGLVAALAFVIVPAGSAAGLQVFPLVQLAPDITPQGGQPPACTTPAPVFQYAFFHCYTPADMDAAYGVDTLHNAGITGAGQTIVVVDSYGSPTALSDLQFFSTTFGLPAPNLHIIYPCGQPSYAMHGIQINWAFETSLDLQWSHTIAPDANIVLVATNPAETQGEQGLACMLKGEQTAVSAYPGAVISQSFGTTEQAFHGGADPLIQQFDSVFKQAVANHVTVFASSGDSGTANVDKQGREYPFPTVIWPSSDPLVTSAGGTWLQYGWTWDPLVSADQFYACLGAGNPFNTCAAQYLNFNTGPGRTEAVWKEDWLPAATGGGRSSLFPTPSFQSGIPQ